MRSTDQYQEDNKNINFLKGNLSIENTRCQDSVSAGLIFMFAVGRIK